MKCPFCQHQNTEVIETRDNDEQLAVRRRRQCTACQKRFTTYEKIEEITGFVLKKDGRKEKFDAEKLKKGLTKACRKTKITFGEIEDILNEVKANIFSSPNSEISSQTIGQIVADRLIKSDEVAYLRFISVFKEFENLADFKNEIKKIVKNL